MSLDDIFNFIIDFFVNCITWIFNLPLPLLPGVSIPFGLLLISFFVFGLVIKFLFSIFISK